MSQPRLTVRTESGTVLGARTPFGIRFRNVPFAAPPFGARRLMPAQPPQRWSGLRDGARPGAAMPQTRYSALSGVLGDYTTPGEQGEDALVLEIDTPTTDDARMPVLVWLHGGGFTSGGASEPCTSGWSFARDGVVHVAVNYRLGLDGFHLFEDAVDDEVDNLALRDVVAALDWVRREIRGFGGDPDRVTIGGLGVGATLAGDVLVSPLARGLVHGAVLQDPLPLLALRPEESAEVRAILRGIVGRPVTRELVRSAPVGNALELTDAALRAVMRNPARWSWFAFAGTPFCATIGTPSLPLGIADALAAGAAPGLPILLGTTTDQLAHLVAVRLDDMHATDVPIETLAPRLGLAVDALDAYRDAPGMATASGARLAARALTDLAARAPASALLETHDGPGFLYEFHWRSPGLPEDAACPGGLEVPFVRDDFARLALYPETRALYPDEPARELIDLMHGAFVEFVRTGDPGWQPYDDAERSTMCFSEVSAVVPDPAADARHLWADTRLRVGV